MEVILLIEGNEVKALRKAINYVGITRIKISKITAGYHSPPPGTKYFYISVSHESVLFDLGRYIERFISK